MAINAHVSTGKCLGNLQKLTRLETIIDKTISLVRRSHDQQLS